MTWVPELPPNANVDRPRLMEWLVRNFRKLSIWSGTIETEIISYGALITDDAGDGTVQGDLNATDFTGHPYANAITPTSLDLLQSAQITFGHKNIAYHWIGPRGVTVGIGGSYTALAADLIGIGTSDHAILVNRDAADQHPMSAITGLLTDQTRQDNNLSAHEGNTSNPHQVTHDQLVGINPEPDPHPQYAKIQPGMVLGGSTDSFTLNTTDSKLVNYSLSGEYGGSSGNIDALNGEITIPSNGLYTMTANIIGSQGNSTKEEWIELKYDIAGVERNTFGVLDVTTDKTSLRQIKTAATRTFTAGQVISLWLWASAGLGTFTVTATSFEVHRLQE